MYACFITYMKPIPPLHYGGGRELKSRLIFTGDWETRLIIVWDENLGKSIYEDG